jgi:hypothetical protein
VTAASAWHAASLTVLIQSVIESPLVSFLCGWPKIIFPVHRRPIAITVYAMYLVGIVALIIIVARWPWGFVVLRCFSLLLELAKV